MASRSRNRDLRKIHAIARATGLSRSDLHIMAGIALGVRGVDSLGDLDDSDMSRVAQFMDKWQRGLDAWRLGGAFMSVAEGAWATLHNRENMMSNKESVVGNSGDVGQQLSSFRDEMNKELRSNKKKTGANSELRNPSFDFGMLPDDKVIRSGVVALDVALGVGGLLRGTFNIVIGPSGSMKTGLCLNFVKWAQDHDVPVFYFDSENALTPAMMHMMGISEEKMLVSGTSKLDVLHSFLRKINDNFSDALIVIDSLPGFLAPSSYEKDNSGETSKIASEASMWNEILSREVDACYEKNNTIIAVNQLRKNFDRMNKYSPTHKPWGTERLEYAASTYIETRAPKRGENVTDDMGFTTMRDKTMRLHIKKNKAALPGVSLEVPVVMGEGVDAIDDVINRCKGLPVEKNPLFYPAVRYDEKADEFKNSTNKFCTILIDDEVLNLIREDEPDFEPSSPMYHVWAAKDDEDTPTFHEWLKRHPTYMNYAKEIIVQWLIEYRDGK